MEFAKGSDQELHDRLVKSMVTYCKENGYKNIRADLPGHDAPSKLGNHVPDLTAQTKDDAWLVCEAEPCGNVDTDHTKEQMTDFARYTATVVLLADAQSALTDLGDFLVNRANIPYEYR